MSSKLSFTQMNSSLVLWALRNFCIQLVWLYFITSF